MCCILSKFYIKPQHGGESESRHICCILSKFYIKPQPPLLGMCILAVVSYRNSTSNHNIVVVIYYSTSLYLIEILHQTTTISRDCFNSVSLYLIEILHQTTTPDSQGLHFRRCILSKFYIKPQPVDNKERRRNRCILSKFYIKPQPVLHSFSNLSVVSYRNSTSNHNRGTS